MTYQEALDFIYTDAWKGSVPGLSRIRALMARLGNPQRGLRFVHIVGTNGKGSTASMLSSVLTEAGYRVGLFTSPYVVTFRERMQICGQMISPEALGEVCELVKPVAWLDEDRPTWFELVTAVALVWFARERCDIVILEAGMGGEFDATNVIPAPEVAVFTNIGLDHTEILGDTVEKIALTKSGILKPGCEAVLYPNTPEVEAVIAGRCAALGIPLHRANVEDLTVVERSIAGQSLQAGALRFRLPLLGEHQRRNCAVVLQVLRCLQDRGFAISSQAVCRGLETVTWPGRFEILQKEPLFILDGGHNPQCMDALLQTAGEYLAGRPLTVITGVLHDKDYAAMYDKTAPLASAFFTLTPPNPRALDASELAKLLARYGKPVTVCQSAAEAVSRALAATPKNGAVLAYGSLYMAGEIRACFLPPEA